MVKVIIYTHAIFFHFRLPSHDENNEIRAKRKKLCLTYFCLSLTKTVVPKHATMQWLRKSVREKAQLGVSAAAAAECSLIKLSVCVCVSYLLSDVITQMFVNECVHLAAVHIVACRIQQVCKCPKCLNWMSSVVPEWPRDLSECLKQSQGQILQPIVCSFLHLCLQVSNRAFYNALVTQWWQLQGCDDNCTTQSPSLSHVVGNREQLPF